MSRQCRNCGTTIDPSSISCMVCHQSLVRAMRLEGAAGTVELAIGTVVGQALLRRIVGDESRFATIAQFRIERDHGGAWHLRPAPEARNPTFVNGAPVPDAGHRLSDGDQVSLAGKAAHLTVRFLMEGDP